MPPRICRLSLVLRVSSSMCPVATLWRACGRNATWIQVGKRPSERRRTLHPHAVHFSQRLQHLDPWLPPGRYPLASTYRDVHHCTHSAHAVPYITVLLNRPVGTTVPRTSGHVHLNMTRQSRAPGVFPTRAYSIQITTQRDLLQGGPRFRAHVSTPCRHIRLRKGALQN